jgi:hypothetical protein
MQTPEPTSQQLTPPFVGGHEVWQSLSVWHVAVHMPPELDPEEEEPPLLLPPESSPLGMTVPSGVELASAKPV